MKRDELDLLIKNGFLNSKPDRTITENELGSLVNQGFLEKLPNHFFSFNNNLTWEVIYETLLYSERRLLHNLIALHIEKHSQDKLNTISDLLLYHFDRALNYKKCVYYAAMAGDHASSMYAITDAITNYQKSIETLHKVQSAPSADLCLIHEHIADIHEVSGKYEKAISHYTEALKAWKTVLPARRRSKYTPWILKPSVYEALICRKIAMSHEHKSEYNKAYEWIDKAEAHLPKKPGIVLAQICSTRSVTLHRTGEHTAAIEWGKKALQKARKLNASSEIAYANNMLANPYIVVGEIGKAITHLKEASKLYEQQEDLQGIAITNYNLGRCLATTGNLKEAKYHFETVLKIDEKLHNKSALAMDHFTLGNILLMQYEFKPAVDHLTNVINLYDSGNCRPDLAGIAYMYLGKANIASNDLQKAEGQIFKGIALLTETGDSSYLVNARVTLAELYNAKKCFHEAESICQDTLQNAIAKKDKILEIESYRTLGVSLAGLDNIDKSISTLNKSVTLASSMGLKNHEANSIYEKVKILIENNIVTDEDISSLKYAIKIFEDTGATYDLKQARNLLDNL